MIRYMFIILYNFPVTRIRAKTICVERDLKNFLQILRTLDIFYNFIRLLQGMRNLCVIKQEK